MSQKQLDSVTKALSTYPGRDKAIRSLAFYLLLHAPGSVRQKELQVRPMKTKKGPFSKYSLGLSKAAIWMSISHEAIQSPFDAQGVSNAASSQNG